MFSIYSLLQILKILNSNSETPYLIWDNSTRAELINFLEKQRNSYNDIDLNLTNNFKYSAHSDQLRIGGIYIKVYNQQPTYPLLVSYHYSFIKLLYINLF